MNDKKLFEIMIKYHPTIIGWMKRKTKMFETSHTETSPRTFSRNFKVYEVYYNGVKRIEGRRDEDFIEITLINRQDFEVITKDGIDIFEFNNSAIGSCCHISQLEELLERHCDKILDLYILGNHPRLRGKAINGYMQVLEQKMQFIKDKNFNFKGWFDEGHIYSYNIYGESDCDKELNIKDHGIFASETIYERIEWTFDLVEMYKDQIIWHLLINKSNLIWNEDDVIRYEKYILSCDYIDYSKFSKLSSGFLRKHKDFINWNTFIRNGCTEWNAEDMKFFFTYISQKYPSRYTGIFADLLDNKRFYWTSENLLAFLLESGDWDVLIRKHRPHLYSLLLQIPNIGEIAKEHVKELEDFWQIVTYNKKYSKLAKEFTLSSAIQNVKEWSIPLYNKILKLRSSRDDILHRVMTQWDIYAEDDKIPLTYELAKYLSNIKIQLGGTYYVEINDVDGSCINCSNFPILNGLQAFSHHCFASTEDMVQCLKDEAITDILLDPNNYQSDDLLSFIVENFFKDYSVEEYLRITSVVHSNSWCQNYRCPFDYDDWFLGKYLNKYWENRGQSTIVKTRYTVNKQDFQKRTIFVYSYLKPSR